MSNVAIHVENLGKRYRIGQAQVYRTLRESIVGVLSAPFRRARLRQVSANHATKTVPADIWALRNVSFDVGHGEVMGLVGRNGAGKSTLLKILSRITPPTEGTATIHGRVGSLLEVGTGFHHELTGRENVYLSGAILGMRRTEIRRRFGDIVAFAEIDDFLDTPFKYYSSGMQMRLAFAVAAHLEPEILLIDEVLAVGDAAFQKKCLGKMRSVAQGGRTVLFVSHNMAAVTQLCDSAIWLDQGHALLRDQAEHTVRAYISNSDSLRAERHWEDPLKAPGDDRVRLRACRVIQEGEIALVVDINKPTRVEIEFTLSRPSKNLVTGVSIYDLGGQCIFNSCDWRPNALEVGRYMKSMEIPEQTLAEGRFTVLVQCVFFEPHVPSVVVRDALTFDSNDSKDPNSVRGHYKGEWPGLVRLRLAWSEAALLREGSSTRLRHDS